jgi:hypothetical protein
MILDAARSEHDTPNMLADEVAIIHMSIIGIVRV